MKYGLAFAEAAKAGIAGCTAYAHQGGQTYRLVFTLQGVRNFTVQSGRTEGGEEIGFLAFEERLYEPDSRSLKVVLPLKGQTSRIEFYVVQGCDEPARVSIQLETGPRLTVSCDAFPYGLAYDLDGTQVGLAQYDDSEYRTAL